MTMRLSTTVVLLLLLSASDAFSSERRPISRFLGSAVSSAPRAATLQQNKRRFSPASTLSMHMGHSHSHHHHLHHEEKPPPLSPLMKRRKRRRLVALISFCAVATLVVPRWIYRRRAIHNADVAAFLLSSIALASADKIRRELLAVVQKFRATLAQVAKHSPPLQTYVKQRGDAAMRVTVIGVVINLLLSAGKFVVGVASHSSALIADAGHSLSDLVSDFVTLYTVQIARLPPDDDHPYGHGKFEAIGSLFLALTLLATGVSVGAMSNRNLMSILTSQRNGAAAAASVALPKPPALIMAALSIFSKEWLFRITRVVGQRLNSQVVLANAWHHRTDAYSSVLALVSIGLAMYVPGLLAADSFAGLLVAGMICMTGADILGESIRQLSDSNHPELVKKVTKLLQRHPHVDSVTRVRARQVGSQALVDVQLTAADNTDPVVRLEEEIRQQILTDSSTGDAVMDAEVRAVPLTKAKTAPASQKKLEARVRDLTTTLEGVSVESVSIADDGVDNALVKVEIRVLGNPQLAQARRQASQLRQAVQALEGVGQAKIFLDLSEEGEDLEDDFTNGFQVILPDQTSAVPSQVTAMAAREAYLRESLG